MHWPDAGSWVDHQQPPLQGAAKTMMLTDHNQSLQITKSLTLISLLKSTDPLQGVGEFLAPLVLTSGPWEDS